MGLSKACLKYTASSIKHPSYAGWLKYITSLHPKFRKIIASTLNSIPNYVEATGDRNTITYLSEEDRVLCYSEPRYERVDEPLQYTHAKPLYIASLKDVNFIPATNLITTSEGYGLHDMCYHDRYIKRIDFGSQVIKGRIYNEKLLSILPNRTIRRVNKGVIISGNFSMNYFHFTLELMPRFMYIDQYVPHDVPLIIDTNMTKYPQFGELIKIFNKSNREIMVLDPTYMYHFECLYYPEISPVVTPNVIIMSDLNIKDIMFEPCALEFIRNSLMTVKSDRQFPKKIYLYREGGVRSFNQDEVFAVLKPLGFEKVSTDKMSVPDQVALFNGAEVIVGGSGAAFTNLLYCTQGCKVYILLKYVLRESSCFSSIASFAGVDLIHLAALQTGCYEDSIDLHRDFTIDPELVKNFISEDNIDHQTAV